MRIPTRFRKYRERRRRQPQRYERAGKEHHHHFNCNRCGRTFEMDGCPGGLERMVPGGFKMETHEVFIYGLCEECNVSP